MGVALCLYEEHIPFLPTLPTLGECSSLSNYCVLKSLVGQVDINIPIL